MSPMTTLFIAGGWFLLGLVDGCAKSKFRCAACESGRLVELLQASIQRAEKVA